MAVYGGFIFGGCDAASTLVTQEDPLSSTARRPRRLAATIASVGAAALVIAGCTSDSDDGDDTPPAGDNGNGTSDVDDPTETGDNTGDTPPPEGTITVGVTNAVTSLNSGTPTGNLNTNGMVEFLMGTSGGHGSLWVSDADYNIVRDETSASYELVSDDPLIVTYTVTEGALWSDGEPISVDDLLLSWVIGSGYFNDGTTDDEGEVISGTNYFSLAGSTTGLDTTAFPEIDRDAGTLTLEYSELYVDWELVNLIGKPAHVFAEKGGFDSAEELTEFFTDLGSEGRADPENPADASAELQTLADFWNTGYNITSFPDDESLLVGVGPFVVTDFQAEDGGFISFEPNPNFGGDPVQYSELIFSFIGDADAQVAALRNGEVDIIDPQPSADTLAALDAAGAELFTGDQLSYDHLDLNFGSEVFSDPEIREAFLLTIPRQQILDSLIVPINPDAEVLNSQLFIASQAQYEDAIAVNGYDRFDEPDIDAAIALLDGRTPEVRILYSSENPNRVDTFTAIQASAQEAGFVIVDGGSPTWSAELAGGDYDASIFGWISSGVGYAGLPQIWKTGGGGNYNNYSNSEVDTLVDESQITIDDADRLDQIQIEIDTHTAADFYGLPLFQLPGIQATSGEIDGYEFRGNATGPAWSAHLWSLSD